MAVRVMTDGEELTPTLVGALVLAFNERRGAAVASGAAGMPDALDVTPGNYWSLQGGSVEPLFRVMQRGLEAMAPAFVDHTGDGPYDLFTVETWREVAGLHEDGFRRATEYDPGVGEPEWEYGLVEDGDILQYWIVDDLMKGLNALRWTKADVTGYREYEHRDGRELFPATYGTLSSAVASCDALWASAPWMTTEEGWTGGFTPPDSAPYGIDEAIRWGHVSGVGSGSSWDVRCFAWRSKPYLEFVESAPVGGDVEFWGTQIKQSSTDTYYDFEGKFAEDTWGKVCEGAWEADDDEAVSTGTTMDDASDTPATDALAAVGGSPTTAWSATSKTDDSASYTAVLKWAFSDDFEAA